MRHCDYCPICIVPYLLVQSLCRGVGVFKRSVQQLSVDEQFTRYTYDLFALLLKVRVLLRALGVLELSPAVSQCQLCPHPRRHVEVCCVPLYEVCAPLDAVRTVERNGL